MQTEFIKKLLDDIEIKKLEIAAIPYTVSLDDIPIQSILGTVRMCSSSGSIVDFYSWIDPEYCHGPLYNREEVHMTNVIFHKLSRQDKAFFRKWDDFTLYDISQFHKLICELRRAGFVLKVISTN